MHTQRPDLISSFKYALQGFIWLMAHERNFKIHIGISVLVVVLGACLHVSTIEWTLLVFAIVLVLSLEVLNTAIERLADIYCQREYDPLIKIVKDISAAACLIGAIGSLVIGLLIFGPHLWALLESA